MKRNLRLLTALIAILALIATSCADSDSDAGGEIDDPGF